MNPKAGRTCRWLICRGTENPQSMNKCAKVIKESEDKFVESRTNALHIAHATRRCLHCCGTGANSMQCKCTDITDQTSFKKCQYKNDCAAHLWCSRDCHTNWPNDFPADEYNLPHHWSRCPNQGQYLGK